MHDFTFSLVHLTYGEAQYIGVYDPNNFWGKVLDRFGLVSDELHTHFNEDGSRDNFTVGDFLAEGFMLAGSDVRIETDGDVF